MFDLLIKTSFSSAHALREYDGDCARVHGHNWHVHVTVTGEELNELGILIDFKVLKKTTNEIIDKLDHRMINEIEPFTTINPTAENIAKYLYEEIGSKLNDNNVKVKKITIFETEKASATYYEPA